VSFIVLLCHGIPCVNSVKSTVDTVNTVQIASDSDPDKYFKVFYPKNPIKLLILRGFVVYDKNKTDFVSDPRPTDCTR
jgi:hypothetical protein